MEIPFKIEVRDGRAVADVTIGDGNVKLTASGVSKLIRELADTRAQMEPAFDIVAPTTINVVVNALFELKGAGPMGGAFIGFRHSGLGWLHFHLTHTSVALLSKGFAQADLQTPPPEQLQ